MYVLNANHISKSYKTAGETMRILQNVNLQVMKGEMVAIMGPSGSGKTTLLHVLTGVDTPDDGEIVIGGETFSELTEEEKAFFRRKHMGMIFQDFQLLESLTVKENILLPLILERKQADIQQERFSRIADVLGIEKLADKGITEISGGQKQRVAIARALASDPKILLCDEATSALDPQTTSSILELLKDINQRFGITIVVITHQMAVVREICNQVAIMKDGQVVEHGRTIDIFNHPKSEVARELLQKDEGNATEPKTLKTADRIKNGTRIRIVYTENSAFEPVIANMILTFKEPVNILKAATKNVGGVAKGEMILELPKGSTNVAAMEQYLKERGLELEELSNNVNGGEEHVDGTN